MIFSCAKKVRLAQRYYAAEWSNSIALNKSTALFSMSAYGLLFHLLAGYYPASASTMYKSLILSQRTSPPLPYRSAINCQVDGQGMSTPTFDLTHVVVLFATSFAWFL
jgi:hypothetical protein